MFNYTIGLLSSAKYATRGRKMRCVNFAIASSILAAATQHAQ